MSVLDDVPRRAAPESTGAVPRGPQWIRRRARNVYRRPLLAAAVAVAVFVAVLVVSVVVPFSEQRAMAAVRSPRQRPDTLLILSRLASAARRARVADSVLGRARTHLRAAAADAHVAGGTDAARAERDLLAIRLAILGQLLRRATAAPLPASYRALGESEPLRHDPRVSRLLDTLARIEASRASFGSTSGVDPIFVALTARATQVGRSIEQLADERRTMLERRLAAIAPVRGVIVPRDTVPIARTRDSAMTAVVAGHRWLVQARLVDRAMDASEDRARAAAALGASIPAVLAGACVLGVVLGFAAGLTQELYEPTVADAEEAREISGTDVLVEIGTSTERVERRRREDQEMPPLIDVGSEYYGLLFGQLADRADNLGPLTMVGDDAEVTAIITANLGATVARRVRSVLLVDADVSGHSMSRVARVSSGPGLSEVLGGRAEWPEVVQSIIVGRGRVMDVLAAGSSGAGDRAVAEQQEVLCALVSLLRRRYECVLLSAPARSVGAGAVVVVGDVLVCARVGRTTLAGLRSLCRDLQSAGASVRGLALWDRGDPLPSSA